MSLPPIPVDRYLVPEVETTTPEGYTRLDLPLMNGMPQRFQLDDQTTAVCNLPNGLAITWRDTDPKTAVSESAPEYAPAIPADQETAHPAPDPPPPARLMLRFGNNGAWSSVPLVAGRRQMVPSHGEPDQGTRIELVVLGWSIRSGNMRGFGDFGSTISLAWRHADRAVNHYSTPVVNPHIIPRLKPEFKMVSILGLRKKVRLRRFKIRRWFLR